MSRFAASVVLAVVLVGMGCSGRSKEPAAAPDADEGAPAASGQVVCHLDCSGQERQASAATQEEAQAALRAMVDETCRPEDGQYFIFCDPVE